MRLMHTLNGMALIVLMLAGTRTMYGQRETKEKKPFSLPMSADCQHTDPNDEHQVYNCLSSVRYDRGLAEGRNVFEEKTGANCTGLSSFYTTGLCPRNSIIQAWLIRIRV